MPDFAFRTKFLVELDKERKMVNPWGNLVGFIDSVLQVLFYGAKIMITCHWNMSLEAQEIAIDL
jgi:hypothetical protein